MYTTNIGADWWHRCLHGVVGVALGYGGFCRGADLRAGGESVRRLAAQERQAGMLYGCAEKRLVGEETSWAWGRASIRVHVKLCDITCMHG